MGGIRVNFKKIGPTEFISICMKLWRLIMLDDLFLSVMWPLPYKCKNKVLFSKASLRNIRQKLASLSSILGTHVART